MITTIIIIIMANDMCAELLRDGLKFVSSPDNNPWWLTGLKTPTIQLTYGKPKDSDLSISRTSAPNSVEHSIG